MKFGNDTYEIDGNQTVTNNETGEVICETGGLQCLEDYIDS